MKHVKSVALVVFFLSMSVYGQTLRGVKMLGGNGGSIVGFAGVALRTADGGSGWTPQSSGTTMNLHAVSFTDANNGTAVGGDEYTRAAIIHTVNGGATWTSQTTSATNSLQGVSFGDANNGVAVGNNGTIVRTGNAGATWTNVSSGTLNHLISVSMTSASNGVAVGYLGTILRTADGGNSWTAQSGGTINDLIGVYFVDANNGTAVGATGTILHTVNGGSSWTAQSSGVPYDLYGVYFSDANTGTVVGYAGRILRTVNGGATWTQQASGTALTLTSVSFTDANNGVVVGASNTILKTNNGGSTWSAGSIGSGGGGGGGTVDVTPPVISAVALSGAGASNASIAWVTDEGSSSVVEYGTTTSYGSSASGSGGVTSHSVSLAGLSPNTVYHYHVKSTDASGNLATSADHSFQTGGLYNYNPVSTQIMVGSLSSGSYTNLSTSDNTYYNVNSSIKGTRVSDWYGSAVISQTPLTVKSITVTYSGKFSRSTTQVLYLYDWTLGTWTQVDSRTVSITNVSVTINESAPGNYISVGGEVRLRVVGTGTTKNFMGSADFLQVTVETSGVSLSKQASPIVMPSELPASHRLYQNFPNPFNPTTEIRYELSEPGNVKLSVFNLLGQEVAALVNDVQSSGVHSVQWSAVSSDGTQMPSGIYIYRVQVTSVATGQVFTEAKRMMLVK